MFSSHENPDRQINRMFRFAGLVLLMILTALGLTQMTAKKMMSVTNKNRLREEMTKVRKALNEYERNSGHLPGGLKKSSEDTATRTSGLLVYQLLELDKSEDERPLLNWSLAKNNKTFGLVYRGSIDQPMPDSVSLVDLWGEPYYIIIDTNLDEHVPNPETDRKPGWFSNYLPPATLPIHCALFSSGPDKNPSTWDDNVCSWR